MFLSWTTPPPCPHLLKGHTFPLFCAPFPKLRNTEPASSVRKKKKERMGTSSPFDFFMSPGWRSDRGLAAWPPNAQHMERGGLIPSYQRAMPRS